MIELIGFLVWDFVIWHDAALAQVSPVQFAYHKPSPTARNFQHVKIQSRIFHLIGAHSLKIVGVKLEKIVSKGRLLFNMGNLHAKRTISKTRRKTRQWTNPRDPNDHRPRIPAALAPRVDAAPLGPTSNGQRCAERLGVRHNRSCRRTHQVRQRTVPWAVNRS